MLESPYIIFAIVDLLLGIVLLLQVTEIYPLVRLRAAIGLGTLTILFLTSGDPMLALANGILCVSMYVCTATLSTPKVISLLHNRHSWSSRIYYARHSSDFLVARRQTKGAKCTRG